MSILCWKTKTINSKTKYTLQAKNREEFFGEKAARNQLLPPKIFLNNYVHLSAYDVIYYDHSYRKGGYWRNI